MDKLDGQRETNRYLIAFPVLLEWEGDDGKLFNAEGATVNVGFTGALVYMPKMMPTVGVTGRLSSLLDPPDNVVVTTRVLRLDRDISQPQVAVRYEGSTGDWQEMVERLLVADGQEI